GRLRSLRQTAQSGLKLAAQRRVVTAERLDRMSLEQAGQLHRFADALPARQLQRGRAPGEENLEQLALTKQGVELNGCRVDQKQHDDPDLHRDKPIPGE